jgi:Ser/Thr protein kinase RdoA (MazF antagonist)
MEVAAVLHVARMDPDLPVAVPVPADDGRLVVPLPGPTGEPHLVRLLPFMPGAHVDAADLDLGAVTEIGRTTARLGRALRGFFHPAAGRVILWDIKHLDDLRPHLDAVTDQARRAMVERPWGAFDARVAPALPGLRAGSSTTTRPWTTCSSSDQVRIVDFGDMAHTALVWI